MGMGNAVGMLSGVVCSYEKMTSAHTLGGTEGVFQNEGQASAKAGGESIFGMFQKHRRGQLVWHRVNKSNRDGQEVGRPSHVRTVGHCKDSGFHLRDMGTYWRVLNRQVT